MKLRILCEKGHICNSTRLDTCQVHNCVSKNLWIIDPKYHRYKKFEITIRKGENEKIRGIANVFDIEKALSCIRTTLNSEGITFSLYIKPIEKCTTRIEGYAIISADIIFDIDQKVTCGGFNFELKKNYIGKTEIADYKTSIFKIEFRSNQSFSIENYGKILRHFKRKIKSIFKDNKDIKKILHLNIMKHKPQRPFFDYDDPWMNIGDIY